MQALERFILWTLLALCVAACGPSRDDSELAPVAIGGDFALTGPDGPFLSSSLRGRMVLLFFGYTTCPDVCPTTLARLARVYQDLRREGIDHRVETIFVSVDPERDTPEKLQQYLGYFAVRATGVTGSPAEVAEVAKKFGASYEKVSVPSSAAGYLMNHSTYLYLIDGQGKVRHLFRHEDPPEAITKLVVRLSKEDCCGG